LPEVAPPDRRLVSADRARRGSAVSSEHPWLLTIAPGLCYVRLWSNRLDGMVALASGILDRIDSVCFSAPIFFHLTRYFFTPR
jgi:hypothetical protein